MVNGQVQNGFEAWPTQLPIKQIPGLKRPEREDCHSLQSSAKFKTRGGMPQLPHLNEVITKKTVKVKVTLQQATTVQRGSRYSSTLSLTSVEMEVDGQRHAPAALPPGKTRCPLYRRLGRPQSQSGRVRKIPPPLQDSISGPSSP